MQAYDGYIECWRYNWRKKSRTSAFVCLTQNYKTNKNDAEWKKRIIIAGAVKTMLRISEKLSALLDTDLDFSS
jgi:hypothetical protein